MTAQSHINAIRSRSLKALEARAEQSIAAPSQKRGRLRRQARQLLRPFLQAFAQVRLLGRRVGEVSARGAK